MSYSNYVLNQRLSNIEYQLQHGTPSTSTLENILTNGNSAGGLSITDVSNINVTTINGVVPAGGDVFLAGGTFTTPQKFTGYNVFNNSVGLPSIYGSGIEILFPVSIPSGVQVGAGLAVLWNQDDAITHYGETDFLNYAQDGTGGFVFWNTSTQSAPNIIAKILPSVSPTSNDTTLATTAFVKTAVSNLPQSPSYYHVLPVSTTLNTIYLTITGTGTITQNIPTSIKGTLIFCSQVSSDSTSIFTNTADFTASIYINNISSNYGNITANYNVSSNGTTTTLSGSSVAWNYSTNVITIAITVPAYSNALYPSSINMTNLSISGGSGLSFNTIALTTA